MIRREAEKECFEGFRKMELEPTIKLSQEEYVRICAGRYSLIAP